MTSVESSAGRPARTSVSSARLWAGMLLAPAAWLAAGSVGYYLVSRGCRSTVGGIPLVGPRHPGGVAFVVALMLAVVTASGLAIALGNRHRVEQSTGAREMARRSRAQFMAFGGVLVSTLFLLGTLLFGLSALVVDACNRARWS